jgi:CubicO group peptidase (beta-lactamase class C family)
VTAVEAGSRGGVAPGFEPVRDAFDRAAGPVAAFCAVVDGRRVVDLWSGDGWGGDTATVLFSGTKGVVATALLLLADRGALDLDARVAALWPEFAAAGKERITIAALLAHAAGLPGVERPLRPADLSRPRHIAELLAAQAPILPPGTPSYHAFTWGWLAGEVVRRAGGRSAGRLVADELAGPLGLDVAIGLAAGDPLAARLVAPRRAPGYRLSAYLGDEPPDPRLERVYANPPLPIDGWSEPDLLAIEAPAVNGVATARAMAGLYGALASGLLVRPDTVVRGGRTASEGVDPLSGRPLRFGPTGYELAGTPSVLGPPADALGHTGAGGGSHGAWPSLRTGFSFLSAELRSENADGRARALLEALHGAVAGA